RGRARLARRRIVQPPGRRPEALRWRGQCQRLAIAIHDGTTQRGHLDGAYMADIALVNKKVLIQNLQKESAPSQADCKGDKQHQHKLIAPACRHGRLGPTPIDTWSAFSTHAAPRARCTVPARPCPAWFGPHGARDHDWPRRFPRVAAAPS